MCREVVNCQSYHVVAESELSFDIPEISRKWKVSW